MKNKNLLNKQLRSLEWRLILFITPLFAGIMIYMTFEFCPPNLVLAYFITNLIGVFFGWYIGKTIIFWLKRKMPHSTLKRIGIQLVLSMVATFIFVIVYVYVKGFVFHQQDIIVFVKEDPIFKIISGAALIFMLVLNILYECFFLFSELSDTQLQREQYKKASAEAQLKNLTNKLNPHFLFNSLNTLATIIEENKDKAINFVEELSEVYRYVLNNEKNTWVKLEEELQFSKSYIALLKMRFESNFEVVFDINESSSNSFILPLTLQLLIENAIKHNEISDQVRLNLKISTDGEWLIVSNNVNLRKVNGNHSTKIGLSNIKNRYQLLTQKEVIVENKNGTFLVKVPLVQLKTAA